MPRSMVQTYKTRGRLLRRRQVSGMCRIGAIAGVGAAKPSPTSQLPCGRRPKHKRAGEQVKGEEAARARGSDVASPAATSRAPEHKVSAHTDALHSPELREFWLARATGQTNARREMPSDHDVGTRKRRRRLLRSRLVQIDSNARVSHEPRCKPPLQVASIPKVIPYRKSEYDIFA